MLAALRSRTTQRTTQRTLQRTLQAGLAHIRIGRFPDEPTTSLLLTHALSPAASPEERRLVAHGTLPFSRPSSPENLSRLGELLLLLEDSLATTSYLAYAPLSLDDALAFLSRSPWALPDLASFSPERVIQALRLLKGSPAAAHRTLSTGRPLSDPAWEVFLRLVEDEPEKNFTPQSVLTSHARLAELLA